MRRFVTWTLGLVILETLLVVFLAWLIPGFSIGEGIGNAILAALLVTLLPALAWPFIYWFASRFHPVFFPVLTFGLTGLALSILGALEIAGVSIGSVWIGILVGACITVGNTVLSALFSLNNAAGYDWFVMRPLKRTYAATPISAVPGILFLEIDGLSEPILRQALANGSMPTLRRWLDGGSHTLLGWEPDLSSQTSASQAGILLGDNTGIPAFRWYDKGAGTLMVSSKMQTAQALELRLSTGDGLLAGEGASRWNVFSGDASDCACTFSTFGDKERAKSRSYGAYFANPYTFVRTLSMFIGDVVRERRQARAQVRDDVQPRIHRHFKYAFIRAGTTTAMQEASLFMLISDMYRGTPAVYNTFFAYDEVAHHSGIDRPDVFNVLTTLDRVFALLERAAARAPRPYELVVLSDHGQSMGATFKQRYGRPLSGLVDELTSAQHRVASAESTDEDWGSLNLALSEAVSQDSRTARLARRAVEGRMRGDEVALGPDDADKEQGAGRPVSESDVVVLASGNLGLISFPRWPERMTYEQITTAFPDLIPGLVNHEGIGFVMVHSSEEGGLVIGAEGIRYLDHGYAVREDPLAPYGPNAADHLRRTDGFANAPDILVMSLFDPETGEVAAFEELVGSHGGLGGPQTRPFVLYPARFSRPEGPIVGAAALHRVLKGWRAELASAPPPAGIARASDVPVAATPSQ